MNKETPVDKTQEETLIASHIASHRVTLVCQGMSNEQSNPFPRMYPLSIHFIFIAQRVDDLLIGLCSSINLVARFHRPRGEERAS